MKILFQKVIVLLLLILFIVGSQNPLKSQGDQLEKLQNTVELINAFYVDSVDNDAMVEDAIVAMLEQLDPHSVFIPAKQVARANEPLLGNFEGVGIQFNLLRDTILVVATISGGPSEKVGIIAGDKIVRIDTSNVAGVGFTNRDVIDRLRGKKGTQVDVGIRRSGVDEVLDFNITRDKIPLFSVDATYMASPTTGYIKINRFAAKTAQEFRASLAELKAQGMENLILDLQGNGGGYLNAAFELADEFIGANQLIVYTQGRRSAQQVMKATARGGFEKGKLVVLINEGSASASEIVSGAVQDLDRGIIIGRRTFGKGLVQKPYKLGDGSVIRLTVAKYYTPSGRCIQRPYDEGKTEYYKELRKRLDHGEMMVMDSVDLPDSLMYFTSNGRKVYGGGGILPDVFIPLDTTENSEYYSKVVRKGILNRFVLSFIDKNRAELASAYPDLQSFKTNFNTDEVFVKSFTDFAEEQKLDTDWEGLERSKRILTTQLKALIARNLWDSSAYFEVYNEINPSFREALEVMESKKFKEFKIAYK